MTPEHTPQPHGERGRWIERGPSGKLMLFSGRSHPVLAQRIADQLNIELGDVKLKTFANGEIYCRYRESIRGADVFIVQACHGRATNDYLWELQIMIQAAKLASANRITAIMPWFPYSRQDKKSVAAGADHGEAPRRRPRRRGRRPRAHDGPPRRADPGLLPHPRRPHDRAARSSRATTARRSGCTATGSSSSRPIPGRAKMATKFAQMLDADFALMNKQRPAHDVASVTEVVGDVSGKVAIMSDDIIVTGGTLVAGAQALLEAGATKVYACATHGLFPDDALEKLADSELAGIAVTDTVPITELNRPDKLTVLTISGILAETIENVFSDESVSAIFAGENQLF